MRPFKKKPKTSEKAFYEAVRLYRNGKAHLKGVPISYGAYTDTNPVQEACAAAHLAYLRAIDGYILLKGVPIDRLPLSYDDYRDALEQHIPHNGKLRQAFKVAYQNLHIFGYYRGGVGVDMIKEGFTRAKAIVETLTRRKV